MDSFAHGFLYTRHHLEIDPGVWLDGSGKYIDYPNIPRTIGAVMSSKQATLLELRESYYLDDVYLMLEVTSVDAHNRNIAMEEQEKKAKQ